MASPEERDYKALFYELENAITWNTSCLNCARLLDDNYAQYSVIERIKEIDPATHATGSRDFGRGFSLAMKLVMEVITDERGKGSTDQ
jgi:hypothetical protein